MAHGVVYCVFVFCLFFYTVITDLSAAEKIGAWNFLNVFDY